MSRKSDETLGQIEETQAALRESIASAKKLAADSDRLIKRYRKQLNDPP